MVIAESDLKQREHAVVAVFGHLAVGCTLPNCIGKVQTLPKKPMYNHKSVSGDFGWGNAVLPLEENVHLQIGCTVHCGLPTSDRCFWGSDAQTCFEDAAPITCTTTAREEEVGVEKCFGCKAAMVRQAYPCLNRATVAGGS
jgi:hypothetical protein